MKLHEVRVYPSKTPLKREDQLAWKIAGVAADKVAVTKDVTAMIVNRIIDNASVAIASRHIGINSRGGPGSTTTVGPPASSSGEPTPSSARPSPANTRSWRSWARAGWVRSTRRATRS